jgi:hypothetical protein
VATETWTFVYHISCVERHVTAFSLAVSAAISVTAASQHGLLLRKFNCLRESCKVYHTQGHKKIHNNMQTVSDPNHCFGIYKGKNISNLLFKQPVIRGLHMNYSNAYIFFPLCDFVVNNRLFYNHIIGNIFSA